MDEEVTKLSREVKQMAAKAEDVKLLQTIDGVGPITALAFKAEIDRINRFEKSKDVAAYLGLTPSQYVSGETQRQGRISKKGSKRTRYLLVRKLAIIMHRMLVTKQLFERRLGNK